MAYDPTLPQEGTEIDAVQMRSQFNGLKDLIDAIATITAAQIDSVTTGNPGDPATADVSVVGNTLHFTFSIPQGFTGAEGGPGTPGNNGNDGINGEPGPVGPPGEVSNAQLAAELATAINGTSANTNGVATLDSSFADPDAETLRQKLNELILNGRR